jgi:hypothetical protein
MSGRRVLDCGHPNHGGWDHACAPFVVSGRRVLDIRRLTGAGWRLTSPVALTDEEAMALTFLAAPAELTVGRLVEVVDPDGIRIGRIATIALRPGGRPLAIASIDLT